MEKEKLSVEVALKITFQPQAVFRIRPVSRCTATLPGHSDSILALHFSPDGTRLASGSGDTTLRLWDLHTATPHSTCTGHQAWVLVVSWSPDGQELVTGDMGGTLLSWRWEGGACKGKLKGHTKWITGVAWEPAHLALPSRRFASASRDCTIRVWDVNTRTQLRCMSSHKLAVSSVVWGGTGLLVSGARDALINVWNADSGVLVRQLKGHAHWVNTLALSTAHVLRTGAFDHKGHCPKDLEAAKKAAQARYDEALGGREERLVSGSDDFSMFLWSHVSSKQAVTRMTGHQQLINMVQFSPDGRWLLSASFDKSVKLWHGITGAFVGTFRAHVGPVFQVAWAADSRQFVSSSEDSTIKLWDLRTRKLLVDLPGHSDAVYAVDWSPEGSQVASGGKDAVLKLWRH